MNKLVLIVTIGLGISGCAQESPLVGASGSVVTETAQGSCTPTASPTPAPQVLVDGFFVPCGSKTSPLPQMLYRSGSNVFTVAPMGGGTYSLSLLSVGSHTSTDGRSCDFEVLASGEIKDL